MYAESPLPCAIPDSAVAPSTSALKKPFPAISVPLTLKPPSPPSV